MAVELLTKLGAVNRMLRSVWESPVSDINTPGVGAVAAARQWLEDTSRLIQSRGLSFNTDENIVLTPDVNSNIVLPANTLACDPMGQSRDKDYVMRGSRLYDRKNFTYTITQPVYVRLVTLFDFEELPNPVRSYVAEVAARLFRDQYQQREEASEPNDFEKKAQVIFEDFESDATDHNVFRDSPDVAESIQR